MKRRSFLTASASIVATVLFAPRDASAQAVRRYVIRLAATPRDTSMRAAIAGRGSAEAVLEGRALTVMGKFEGLKSAATSANVHMGPAIAVRGPAVYALRVSGDRAGLIEGSIDLSDEALASLEAGRLYIQLDSESAPEGNLWGWLLSEKQ